MAGKSVLEVVRRVVSGMKDPRVEGRTQHALIDVIVIVLCGVLAGCEGWDSIAEHGRDREEWFGRFLELRNGIPSPDTLQRVFERMWPEEFQGLLLSLSGALHETFSGEVISIDGKSLRGSFDRALGKRMKHIVSAFVSDSGATIAQVVTNEKSNEITAIPELLNLIDIEGAVVTMDAMGCQTEIVSQIIEKDGDYVIGLKGNQGELHKAVRDYFDSISLTECEKTPDSSVLYNVEKGHGRVEERAYVIDENVSWLPGFSKWKGLQSIGMVISKRTIQEKNTEEKRFYISSLPCDVEAFERAVRSHWGIENRSHHVLDVSFGEDRSRIRSSYAPENMAIIRRLANAIFKTDKTPKRSVKAKIRRANRLPQYMEELLSTPIEEHF
jgi:predicted transposase YbfD/YdcC